MERMGAVLEKQNNELDRQQSEIALLRKQLSLDNKVLDRKSVRFALKLTHMFFAVRSLFKRAKI